MFINERHVKSADGSGRGNGVHSDGAAFKEDDDERGDGDGDARRGRLKSRRQWKRCEARGQGSPVLRGGTSAGRFLARLGR
ncbi:hypothetical protein LSTR_LSTR010636 [Laodelphax striatellus]|uniref:Uncharacterized protein n=1 Tax=Laodelphax striatellus TaxID=195883 RepID=A0A482XPZ1_LAOST|nr:hypothetical protein LSTR_LSTR010636 [Laodelphax striatellus]